MGGEASVEESKSLKSADKRRINKRGDADMPHMRGATNLITGVTGLGFVKGAVIVQECQPQKGI